jgi:parallel beta-helix repeat protein
MAAAGAKRRGTKAVETVIVALSVAAGVVTILHPAEAASSVLHVAKRNDRCTDGGPGTQERPFCSIAAAAAVARPGQKVVVRSGKYSERVRPHRSGTPGRPVVYTAAAGHTVVVHGQKNGFYLPGRSWITIRRFAITGTTSHGVKVSNATNVVIRRNEISHAGEPVVGRTGKGIVLHNVSNAVVARNTSRHNTNAGISVWGTSTGVRIFDNVSFSNARGFTRAAAGIDVRGSVGSIISGNRSYDNEDSGINIWTASRATRAYNNVVYRNGDHGIDVNQSDDALVVSNTVHGNVDSGIEVTGSARAQIVNNISVDNGINSPRTSGNIRTDAASAPTTILDYNLLSSSGSLIDWAGTTYTELAAFTANTGREVHGLQSDPRFRNRDADDFRLAADSPAIDSANSDAAGQPATDFAGHPRVNVAAVADTGTGSRTYDDRGAYEFQP